MFICIVHITYVYIKQLGKPNYFIKPSIITPKRGVFLRPINKYFHKNFKIYQISLRFVRFITIIAKISVVSNLIVP